MYTFIKQNAEPVPIDTIEDEHESSRDYKPSFWWNNRRYYLDDFIRCHNNPWIGLGAGFPPHIHGYESDCYVNPLFIEQIGDSAVNIYLETEGE